MTVQINNVTRYTPTTDFESIKNAILGKKYALTLNFVGAARARTLNQNTRSKEYVPNILSFPLSDAEGEVYICPQVAKKNASSYGHTMHDHIGFLFIHGLLHLKGHEHSDTMERLEQSLFQKLIINGKK